MLQPMGELPAAIVMLDGAPRSGKSTIAVAIQELDQTRSWMNLGVDHLLAAVPDRRWPGLVGRPGSAARSWLDENHHRE